MSKEKHRLIGQTHPALNFIAIVVNSQSFKCFIPSSFVLILIFDYVCVRLTVASFNTTNVILFLCYQLRFSVNFRTASWIISTTLKRSQIVYKYFLILI